MSLAKTVRQNSQITDNSGYEIDHTNRRLIVNSYSREDEVFHVSSDLISEAEHHGLEKIWLWAFFDDLPKFIQQGFRVEGIFADDLLHKPAFCIAYYLDPNRGISDKIDLENEIIVKVSSSSLKAEVPELSNITQRLLNASDTAKISKVLAEVFASYPTPVEDPFYLKGLMQKGCLFAGAFHGEELISVAAAYPDQLWQRCEMTDCATLPAYRGRSLTAKLLKLLEPAVLKQGKYSLYTLARAASHGMNRTFYKLGYKYQGRLINNCHIAGQFEDMNLWIKI